jgi:hypothetical protein
LFAKRLCAVIRPIISIEIIGIIGSVMFTPKFYIEIDNGRIDANILGNLGIE